MLYATVNSHGNVETLPAFVFTFTLNQNVTTPKKCFKYNHPTKPLRLICMDGLTLTIVPGVNVKIRTWIYGSVFVLRCIYGFHGFVVALK